MTVQYMYYILSGVTSVLNLQKNYFILLSGPAEEAEYKLFYHFTTQGDDDKDLTLTFNFFF